MNDFLLEARIAARFLKGRRKKRFFSMSSVVAVLGLAFGMGALLTALSIVSGFQVEYKKAILNFNSHLIFMNAQESDDFSQRVKDDLKDDFLGLSPFLYREGMVIAKGVTKGVVLKGVDFDRYAGLSKMPIHYNNEAETKSLPSLILGKSLAEELGVTGGTVRLLFPQASSGKEGLKSLRATTFQVAGTFESGLYEYDSGFVFMDLKKAQNFFGAGNEISGVEVWLKDESKAEGWAEKLKEKYGYPFDVMSWKQLNENIFRALAMEKLIFGILMSVLVAVAGLNLMSTLLMFVIEKRHAIAVLRALGFSWGRVRKIFLLNGLLIGSAGIFLGLIFGGSLLFVLQRWQPITLAPEIYFIRKVPVLWSWESFGWVVLCGFTVIFLASEWALSRMKKLNVIEALH